MKDTLDPAISARTSDSDSFGNRKLIRPTFNRAEAPRGEPGERRERPKGPAPAARKTPPPEQTHAENFYYQKQMQSHTLMVIVLHDGETIHGSIEWYDKFCIKVTRSDGHPNLLIYKAAIKYLYKEGE